MLPKTADDSKLSLSKKSSVQIDQSPKELNTTVPINHIPPPIEHEEIIINTSPFIISKKVVILTFALVIVGCGLFVGGFVTYIITKEPRKGIVFWVSGTLVLIPGLYYLGNFFRIWRMKNRKNKVEIVKEINQQW